MAFQSGKLRLSGPEYIICVGRTSRTLIPQTRTLSDVWWVGQITHKMDVVLADYQRGLSIPRSALMFRSSLIVDLIATLKIGDYD